MPFPATIFEQFLHQISVLHPDNLEARARFLGFVLRFGDRVIDNILSKLGDKWDKILAGKGE